MALLTVGGMPVLALFFVLMAKQAAQAPSEKDFAGGRGALPRPPASLSEDRDVQFGAGETLIEELPGVPTQSSDVGRSASVTSFLDPFENKIFLESYVRERLSEDDLPGLYAALDNEEFAPQWSRVLFAICVLEEDEKAFSVVKDFVSTPWDRSNSRIQGHEATLAIRGITSSVVNLAMLDPALCVPFLQEIFTREGAERFLENWNGYSFPEDGIKRVFLDDLIFSAAVGLLYTRVPANLSVVEDTFYKLSALSNEDRTVEQWKLMNACERVLGERILYEEMGWDAGIEYVSGRDADQAINDALIYGAKLRKQVEVQQVQQRYHVDVDNPARNR